MKVDITEIQYQLFNHWYSWSYAQDSDIKIPFSELAKFGEQNDTLTINVLDNKIELIDKRNKIVQIIRHKKICASVETMRLFSGSFICL